jgi:hypothetical protein
MEKPRVQFLQVLCHGPQRMTDGQRLACWHIPSRWVSGALRELRVAVKNFRNTLQL